MSACRSVAAVVLIAGVCLGGPRSAAAAHFWLSTLASGSAGPEAVSLSRDAGQTVTLYVWGRPTPGRQVRGMSLNVVASDAGVDFVDGSYVTYNTIDVSNDRFEFVTDSSTTPDLNSEWSEAAAAVIPDSLTGINGATVAATTGVRGFGPTCSDGEMNCEIASDGDPAWLIAQFDVKALTAGETIDLRLQIGVNGFVEWTPAAGDYDMTGEVDAADHTVWVDSYGSTTLLAADGNDDGVVNAADYSVWRDHEGELAVVGLAEDTDVRFGVDAGAGVEPLHNAGSSLAVPPGDRETNLPGDDPDATITITSPATSVPEPGASLMAGAALALLARGRGTASGRGIRNRGRGPT